MSAAAGPARTGAAACGPVLLRRLDDGALYRLGRAPGEPAQLLAVSEGGPGSSAGSLRLAHAFSLRDRLDPAFATVPLALCTHQSKPALVLTDPGGMPLGDRLAQALPTAEFLALAGAITRAVGELHARGITHRDLHPDNLLIDGQGRAFVTGFGGAAVAARQHIAPEAGMALCATTPYRAPEQTGRLARPVDQRSDLYALGVLFYRMLCGRLPFQADTAVEWAHFHIAVQPRPPAERDAHVPAGVSAIVMRLLAKPADERYQTAGGLLSDLLRCQRQWAQHGQVADFPLGDDDLPDRLCLPDRLFGRDTEIALLLQVHARVAATGRQELAVISGYSGVGKSAVAQEFQHRVLQPGDRFVSGKFEQYKDDIPYSTLSQALRCLVAEVLAWPAADLAAWRERFGQALAGCGQAVVHLVPDLHWVVGPQPALPALAAGESRLRFQGAVRRFLALFCAGPQVLTLFFDDAQWMDSATLELFAALAAGGEPGRLMLVVAYRSNALDEDAPLLREIGQLRADGAPVTDIALQALGCAEVEHLVCTALREPSEHCGPLARAIWARTDGNPFYARQFLSALADEGLLHFDHARRRWQWDLAEVRARRYGDNVADLVSQKITRLDGAAQALLTTMASLGASASCDTLAALAGCGEAEVHAALVEAERAGLVSRGSGDYRFMHDRIQEACYHLIAEGERPARHLFIARTLAGLARGQADAGAPRLFETVNQFLRSDALVTDDAERAEVAQLYLQAARRASAETAYLAALEYLERGKAVLPPRAWQDHHALCFELCRRHAECEFAAGRPEVADLHLQALAPHASALTEHAAVAWLQITVALALDQSARAIDICLDYLRTVDASLPRKPSRRQAEDEYRLLQDRLALRPIESLLHAPRIADPLREAMLDVLAAVLPPAFFSDQNLVCLVLCRMAVLSIDHGNADASPLAYMYLGMMVGPYFGDYPQAARLGRLGHALVQQAGFARYRARVAMGYACHVMPWSQPIRLAQPLLRQAYETSRDTGDITYSGFAACTSTSNTLFAGEPLDAVKRDTSDRLALISAARFGLIVDIMQSQLQLVRCLQGETHGFGLLDDEGFSEAAFEEHLDENRSLDIAACWYWIRKSQARFIAGDFRAALQGLQRAEPLLWTTAGHLEMAEYHFFAGLVHAALRLETQGDAARRHGEAFHRHLGQLDVWRLHCESNFGSRHALLQAEAARAGGDHEAACRLYDAAADAAHEAGFFHVEALALERAAGYYAGRGRRSAARALMGSAAQGWARWGARGKVLQLARSDPQTHAWQPMSDGVEPAAVVPHAADVDVDTILRISQALAAEKGLSRLIQTLMTIALQHAGADLAVLVMPHDNQLRVEARARTRHEAIRVDRPGTPAHDSELPLSVIHYVLRTRRHVLIDDARQPGPFSADRYIAAGHCRSVLCLPLLRQGEAIGLLYLENALAGKVFTAARVSILSLLASMAATSMENATLGEKESLLQEVHHRVKNNLQLISSLLSLQAHKTGEPAVAELFAESRNRVRAMALVHENLYRAGNFARVPMAAHLQNLCAQLGRVYSLNDRQIRLQVEVAEIELNLGQAVSCGLIVNELVSNALKHAFAGRDGGTITVRMEQEGEGAFALSVADDGIGLPERVDPATPDSLGLQLVEDLSQQLRGALVVRRHPGTAFEVIFESDAHPLDAAGGP